MNIILGNETVTLPPWSLISMASVLAFIITYVSIPTIITVAHKLHLYDRPNGRTSHDRAVPTLGGIAIFAGFVIAVSLFAGDSILREFKFILAALVLLFFTGVKDDLLVIDPRKKLIAQIVAAAIIVILGDIRITNFHGFALIDEISYLTSIVFTILVFVVIINGFNLIDGIDGLASGVAIVTASTFGVWFITAGDYAQAAIAFALAAAIIAFFRFNVFSKDRKIFLGDTGSLSIGLIIAVLAVRFLEYEFANPTAYNLVSAPTVAFGILIVPLFDTLRVFTLRLFGGESPFKADRKHIHHRMLELGCSHAKASFIIIMLNLFFIGMVFLLDGIGNLKLLILVLFSAAFFSYIPVFLLVRRNSEQRAIRLPGREKPFSRALAAIKHYLFF